MRAIYNELSAFPAQWMRNLERAGHIAPGDILERDIRSVTAADLAGYGQVHTFAGVGVWSKALRLAGVPDSAALWTGSCPCQPFSGAGKGAGFDDERHLWPEWFRLIGECRPGLVFGEQVASPDGYEWLDLVSTDLEGLGYAVGPCVLSAPGVGAPHQRHRIFFVAVADMQRREEFGLRLQPGGPRQAGAEADRGGEVGADLFWREAGWLPFRDGKYRPIESEHGKVAHGTPPRMGGVRPGVEHAFPAHAGPSPALPELRCGTGSTTLSLWHARGSGGVHAPQVLRPGLHGGMDDRAAQRSLGDESAPGGIAAGEDRLRDVRENAAGAPRSPCGPGHEQQRPSEPSDVVRVLSPSESFAELRRDRLTARAVRALREAGKGDGALLHAPDPQASVRGRGRDSTDAQVGRRFPLTFDVSPSVGARLHAYGNAIVAPLAAEFIRAVRDVLLGLNLSAERGDTRVVAAPDADNYRHIQGVPEYE